jgi:CheY-like chemotaxis protein
VLASSSYELQNEAEASAMFQAVLSKPVRSQQLYESVAKAVKLGVQSTGVATENSQDQLRSVRVLVVEDNPINQLVVTELLKGWGCTVVALDNGRKAVERLIVDTFDIVLMDVQMPELDGLEATKVIRKREIGSDKHLPVIAMTANAMKGDDERCLAAGMDEYLSKPIQPQKLADTMAKYVGQVVSLEEEAEAPIRAQELLPVFDVEQLNQTTSNKPELQQRILERYLESIGPQSAKLEDAIRLMDRELVRGTAHSLKGSSWTVGALSVADVFRRIEAGADSLSSGALQELITEFEEDVHLVRVRIQEFLREAANA